MKSNPRILLHLAAVCYCNLVLFFVYLMLIRISKLHLNLKPISIAPFGAYTHISLTLHMQITKFRSITFAIHKFQYAHVLSFFVRHFAEMCKRFRVHKGQRRNALPLKQSNKMGKNLRYHLNFVIKRNFAQKGQHQ